MNIARSIDPLLLRSRAGAEETPISAWCSAHRRSSPPEGIQGTSVASRDAEAVEPKDCRAGRHVCNLPRGLHGLQRDCARPHRAQRDGRGLERRSSREHPSCPSTVQSAERIEKITSRPSLVITPGISAVSYTHLTL